MAKDAVPRGGLFDRQSISEATGDGSGFRRYLGPLDLTGIGIAAIIGAGIFFFLGLEARSTGPAVIISLAIAGAAAALAALSYAEFATVLPGNGSAYSYAYAAFGRLPAFLMGWLFINAYILGNVSVAIGWSEFFVKTVELLGMSFPDALAASPADGGVFNLPAALIAVLVTWLVMQGIRESTWVNNALVALKLLIVLFVIVFGAFLVNPSNWQPFSPSGFSGVAASTAVLFFAYLGFDTVAAAGAEARNPRRHLPIGILASVAIATLLYILMAAVVTGMSAPADLEGRAPVAAAFDQAGYAWAATLVTLGALIALATVLFAFHLAMSRIMQAMGRDGFLPPAFERVNSRGTPTAGVLLTGAIAAALGGFMNVDTVVDITVVASIAIYVMVSIGIIALRRSFAAAPFRVPAIIHVAAVVLLVTIVALGISGFIHILFLGWLALGLVVYGFYAHRASFAKRWAASASKRQ
jgi:basic amino acid/polyamine antiporter, APA family